MFKNGKTYIISCIVFLAKILNGCFTYDEVMAVIKDTDSLKEMLKRMNGFDVLIKKSYEDEEEKFYSLFGIIGQEVLGFCFSDALYKAEEKQDSLAASDYLKSDQNYYSSMLKRLWFVYNRNKEFKEGIEYLLQ